MKNLSLKNVSSVDIGNNTLCHRDQNKVVKKRNISAKYLSWKNNNILYRKDTQMEHTWDIYVEKERTNIFYEMFLNSF